MAKRIGVLLSGCGVFDGTEIHEAVITLLALDRGGAEVIYFAPKKDQMHVVDHQAGAPEEGASRNCLVEAARLARGNVLDVATVKAEDMDALVIPGGFGAAKNLCDFAIKGEECSIDPEVDRLLGEVFAAKKPIGAMCIAPALLARHFQGSGTQVSLTIGTCEETGGKLNAMGAKHEAKAVDEICYDEAHKIVSTPAYMLAGSIKEAAAGIEKLVEKVLEIA
jgi:enhancing lycopene biosynthesis protein 2